jgi:manganese transport protein
MKIIGEYKDMLSEKGFTVEILGFWKPNKVIPRSSMKEILTFWSWEPTSYWFQRFTFGTTVDKLRHKISIPLFIVKIKLFGAIRYALYLYL